MQVNMSGVHAFFANAKAKVQSYIASLDQFQKYAWLAVVVGLLLVILALILW